MEKWLIITLLFYAVSSGASVFIPIDILRVHGNALEVATSIAASTLVSIFISIISGVLTDKIFNPKFWITLGSVFSAVLLFWLIFLNDPILLIVDYVLLSIALTLPSPSLNLFVVNSSLSKLTRNVGKYSFLGSLGSLLGLVIGITYISYFWYDVALIVLSILILFFAFKVERLSNLERIKKEHKRHFSIFNSLSFLPYVLTGVDITKRIKGKRRKLVHLMWASAFFIAGIYLFNGPYIPFLKDHGASNSTIFIINVISTFTSLLVYYFVSKGIYPRVGKAYKYAVLTRYLAYIPISISAILSMFVIYTNIFGYAMVGISYALWNISISSAIYISIRHESAASIIGIWGAINSLSAAVFSELSGIIYTSFGFGIIPIISLILMTLSLYIFEKNSRI